MTTLTDRYQAVRAEIAKLRDLATLQAQGLFAEAGRELFDRFPSLVSFSWTQYTPYFNDGDVCEFGVHSDYPDVTILRGDESVDIEEGGWGNKDFKTDEEKQLMDAVKDLLRVFDDSDMLGMFGDHVRVTIARTGAPMVDEYEHE